MIYIKASAWKKTVKPVIKRLLLPTWFGGHLLNNLVSLLSRGEGSILTFHSIDDEEGVKKFQLNRSINVLAKDFERAILHLKAKGYTFVSLDEIYDYICGSTDLSKPFVAVTFDDGYRNIYDNAFPILKKHNIPFTIYLITSWLDGNAIMWWYLLDDLLNFSEHLNFEFNGEKYSFEINEENRSFAFNKIRTLIMKDCNNRELLNILFKSRGMDLYKYRDLALSWGMARSMLEEDITTIGAHTVNHAMLSALSDRMAFGEIQNSIKHLKAKLGIEVDHVAYPFGGREEVGSRIVSLASKMKIKTAVTTWPNGIGRSNTRKDMNIYLKSLPRISIGDENPALFLQELDCNLSGVLPALFRFKYQMPFKGTLYV